MHVTATIEVTYMQHIYQSRFTTVVFFMYQRTLQLRWLLFIIETLDKKSEIDFQMTANDLYPIVS